VHDAPQTVGLRPKASCKTLCSFASQVTSLRYRSSLGSTRMLAPPVISPHMTDDERRYLAELFREDDRLRAEHADYRARGAGAKI